MRKAKSSAAPLHNFCGLVHISDAVFPSLGCRFVSVLDCLDSEGGNTDMLQFRALMNDYHLRDLSSKIKSVLHSKKASGQFVSAYAPYGYRKSAGDKHLPSDRRSANCAAGRRSWRPLPPSSTRTSTAAQSVKAPS